MPVIMTSPEEARTWMNAPTEKLYSFNDRRLTGRYKLLHVAQRKRSTNPMTHNF